MVFVKKHYDELDVYKGGAILLIVLGHSFSNFPVDFSKTDLINIQLWLGTFSLNMFFIASGILFSSKGPWKDFFWKKTKRLMIPWLVFTIFALSLKLVFSKLTHSAPGNLLEELALDIICGKSYWFLYALMVMMILTKLVANKWVLAFVGGTFLLLRFYMNDFQPQYNILCMTRILQYYHWFLVGYLLKEFYPQISKSCLELNHKLLTFISIFLIILMAFVMFMGWRAFPPVKIITMPLLGSTAFWLLSVASCHFSIFKSLFAHFGKYSLQYYLNHLLIMLPCYYVGGMIFGYSDFLSLIIIFVSALFVSWLMLWIEKRIPFVRMLCGVV